MNSFIYVTVTLSIFALAHVIADDPANTTKSSLCQASATQHCIATGYSKCKITDNVEKCFCPHTANWTSVIDVIDKDFTCSVTNSKYLDPHYWFQDLLSASIILMVVFFAVICAYLIPTYAKVDAMFAKTAPTSDLHYIPLLPKQYRGFTLKKSSGKYNPV